MTVLLGPRRQEGHQPGADRPAPTLGALGAREGSECCEGFPKRGGLGLDFEKVYRDYMGGGRRGNVRNEEKLVHLLHQEPPRVSWKARSLTPLVVRQR